MVSRDGDEGKMGVTSYRDEVSFGGDKYVVESDSDDGCTIL